MILGQKKLNLLNNLVSGIGIITLGFIVTVGSINMYTKVINLFVYIFLIFGLSKLASFILNKKIVRNKQVLIGIILNIVFGILMIFFPKIPLGILPIVFSIYLLFNSVVRFIGYVVLKESNLKLRFKYLFFSMFFLVFSLMFLFYPIEKLNLFIMIIGLYCILLGISRIYEFIVDILSDKYKLKIKKKLRITLPVFFEAFIPRGGLKIINKYLDYVIGNIDTKNEESDISIFIHLSKYGFNQFGHMDIYFNNKIYSYGNYDKSSEKLFSSIGDGILFEVNNKEKYLNFCIENSKKTIVEYGIKLTDNQKNKINKELSNIYNNIIDWHPLSELDKKNKYKDYASKLYMATKAKFYKFKKSMYKTYFVLGVNCTYFADNLFRKSGSEILKLVGIITPGTYFEYLEENYKKKNSKVTFKQIYNSDNIGEFYDKNKK